jgi:type II secretory pathway pseudopilin PulG
MMTKVEQDGGVALPGETGFTLLELLVVIVLDCTVF